MEITLSTPIPGFDGSRSLADVIASMRKDRIMALLENDMEVIDTEYRGFERAIRAGECPTFGQCLAAYYIVVTNENEAAYWERDEITPRQYAARKAGLTRSVFRKTYKI